MVEWISKTLGNLTSYMVKGVPPVYSVVDSENTVRVLNQKCNRNYTISYEESRLHNNTKKVIPHDKMLRKGDILINSTGMGTAGRVAQITEVFAPTTFDGHMILLRPTAEIDPLYYGYAIKAFQSKIESLAEGSTGQTEINRKRLQDEIIINYPKSILMQHSIGEFLFQIDNKIALNTQINNNLAA